MLSNINIEDQFSCNSTQIVAPINSACLKRIYTKRENIEYTPTALLSRHQHPKLNLGDKYSSHQTQVVTLNILKYFQSRASSRSMTGSPQHTNSLQHWNSTATEQKTWQGTTEIANGIELKKGLYYQPKATELPRLIYPTQVAQPADQGGRPREFSPVSFPDHNQGGKVRLLPPRYHRLHMPPADRRHVVDLRCQH